MAISTAVTTLKYGIAQVETATVVGTITLSGNATVIVTGAGITGSPITKNVAVLLGDTASVIAGKIRSALALDANITAVYEVGGSTDKVVLTKILASANDDTLNISVANGTCTGITEDTTSDATVAGVDYAKLVDITNYPDLGATPSKLDTTSLTESEYKTSILGLQELPDLTFECNYDEAVYNTIEGLTLDSYCIKLDFGTSGADGYFTWKGQIRIFAKGGGVDEVRKMTVIVSASTAIDFIEG